MTAQIALKNVSLTFAAKPQPLTVLEDISLALSPGEFVVLLGPSGCGKSTILNLVAGFTRPDNGQVLAGGAVVKQPGPSRGMIFQQPNLFPWLSVLDNVTFGPRLGKHNKEEVNAQALDWLARAWLPGPDVLLLDEPFGALDAQTRLMMQELLRKAWLETRTTLLFVTHDVDEALFLADRILVMSARPGKIVEEITLPFGRERDIETLAGHTQYSEIKQHVLHRVRLEAKRHLS